MTVEGVPVSNNAEVIIQKAVTYTRYYDDRTNFFKEFNPPIYIEAILLALLDDVNVVDEFISHPLIRPEYLRVELIRSLKDNLYPDPDYHQHYFTKILSEAYEIFRYMEKYLIPKSTEGQIQPIHLLLCALVHMYQKSFKEKQNLALNKLITQYIGFIIELERMVSQEVPRKSYSIGWETIENKPELHSLEFEFDIPDHLSEEEALEYVKQGVLLADKVYRAHGGSGLEIKDIKVPALDIVPVNS